MNADQFAFDALVQRTLLDIDALLVDAQPITVAALFTRAADFALGDDTDAPPPGLAPVFTSDRALTVEVQTFAGLLRPLPLERRDGWLSELATMIAAASRDGNATAFSLKQVVERHAAALPALAQFVQRRYPPRGGYGDLFSSLAQRDADFPAEADAATRPDNDYV